jgi:ATP-dependent RNA helicase DOB1
MKKVLRKFEYITAEGVLCIKGKFSCELSAADELVLTNMVFDGVFGGLSIDQTVALLSCFVHKEASKDSANMRVRGDMQGPLRLLQGAARNVARACAEAHMAVDEEEYVASFNPGLVDVTFAWSAGAKFVEVCKLTDVFEGSIVRVLRRLEELLRQLAAAALAIGNSELMEMFEEGSKRIRRGVVFTSSLYL